MLQQREQGLQVQMLSARRPPTKISATCVPPSSAATNSRAVAAHLHA
jgi:hypothetical protein